MLEAIWSIGVRYSGVQNVIDRYRQHRRRLGADPDRDRLLDLLATIDQAGSSDGFAELVNNRQLTASRGGILKAAAVAMAAWALTGQGVDNVRDLHHAIAAGQAGQLKLVWLALPGQRSGISWRYLLMLAGIPEVKPDRMICRFVANALQLAQVHQQTAADLVMAVAELPPTVPLRALDHAIWSYQRSITANRNRHCLTADQRCNPRLTGRRRPPSLQEVAWFRRGHRQGYGRRSAVDRLALLGLMSRSGWCHTG